MKNSVLCTRFLEWAARNRPLDVPRYRQFLEDFLAYRITSHCRYLGVCRDQEDNSAGVFLRRWTADFGMFEVLCRNCLAQSFALDTGVQLLDWASESGYI